MKTEDAATIETPVRRPRHGLHTALASIAAVGSILAASSCCLPILPFVFAAGAAGGSAFLSAARPYFVVASGAFIAYGFFQAARAKRCLRKTGPLSTLLLLISTVFVVLAIFFPQVIANIAASLLAR